MSDLKVFAEKYVNSQYVDKRNLDNFKEDSQVRIKAIHIDKIDIDIRKNALKDFEDENFYEMLIYLDYEFFESYVFMNTERVKLLVNNHGYEIGKMLYESITFMETILYLFKKYAEGNYYFTSFLLNYLYYFKQQGWFNFDIENNLNSVFGEKFVSDNLSSLLYTWKEDRQHIILYFRHFTTPASVKLDCEYPTPDLHFENLEMDDDGEIIFD